MRQGKQPTPTDTLIRELRRMADMGIVNHRADTGFLREAADRLEEMDERIAIMAESMDEAWGRDH